jgi:hypothetical protein
MLIKVAHTIPVCSKRLKKAVREDFSSLVGNYVLSSHGYMSFIFVEDRNVIWFAQQYWPFTL